jgi:hypothetical protein
MYLRDSVSLKQIARVAALVGSSFASASAEEPPHVSFQSSSDVTSYGTFYTDLSAKYSPFGNLWEQGWQVQATASARRYSIIDTSQKRFGLDTTIDSLAGYQFTSSGWSWLLAAGPSIVNTQLYEASGPSPSSTLVFGIKVLSSVYGNPTSNTMLYGQAHYNTGSEFFYMQGKTGVAIVPDLFVGPEVVISGNGTDDQVRVGGHITGFNFVGLQSGVSLGLVRDSAYGNGFYGALNFQANF